jgi:hypothetical protein
MNDNHSSNESLEMEDKRPESRRNIISFKDLNLND